MKRNFNCLLNCHYCESAIFDKYFVQVDGKSWHESCLKCEDCDRVLTETCFVRNGKLLCAEDYERRKRCFKCDKEIPRNEFIQKVKFFDDVVIFHLLCFACHVCSCRLTQGMDFIITDEGHLLCANGLCTKRYSEEDQDIVDHVLSCDPIGSENHVTSLGSLEKGINETSIHTSSEIDWMNSNNLDEVSLPDSVDFNPSNYGTDANLPNQQVILDQRISNMENFEGIKQASPEQANSKNKGKRRGPRTSIKANQLKELTAAYEVSSKPAKSTREALAKKTGLEMRVIQVWFQNRRSKERRAIQALKLNGNQNFYDGNMAQKYRCQDAFSFVNSNFRDQRLFYPLTFASTSSARSPHPRPSSFFTGPSWIHPASEHSEDCYNFQSNNASTVTSQCPAALFRNKKTNEECYHSSFLQKESNKSSMGRPGNEPDTRNLTFDPYHLNVKAEPLWHHQQ